MCFTIVNREIARKEVKHRRMRVWKRFNLVVENGRTIAYKAPIRGTLYELDSEVKVNLRRFRPHMYGPMKRELRANDPVGRIEYGIHSYSTREQAMKRRHIHEVVVECWLPIGTRYYINPIKHEIVSTQLNVGPMPDPRK